MAKPTKKGIPASAMFVYDDATDKYTAWDGTVDLDTGDLATEETAQAIAGLITEPFDYIVLTRKTSVPALGEIETATYKSGGAGGTTVGTLTLTYDSAGRLSTVTKT